MTTFVRRIPDTFDEAYWHASARYMERELGDVPPEEAQRHENPAGFTDTAGQTTGQRKDMSYCFAPYDGLRGLGMPDVHEYAAMGELKIPEQTLKLNFPEIGPKLSELVDLSRFSKSKEEPSWKKALPYMAVGGGVLALLFLMRK